MKRYKIIIAVAALLTIGVIYRYIPHSVFAKEPAIASSQGTAGELPSCHIPDDGGPIVVPEQKK
ncbi:hypothetical protein [Paenibacillus sp. SI8]|uniref:hypothetical protein n=1 Tax=unclassified Paenibacillus TaxID=185978 RepID=UPI0034670CA6